MVFGYWVWLFWAVPVPISGFVFAFRPACRPAFAGADVGRKVSLMMDTSKPVERLGINRITGGMKRCMGWPVLDWLRSFRSR